MLTQRRAQPRQRLVAVAHPQPYGQLAHARFVARERVSLQAGNDLEFMFDVAQEEIGLGKIACARGRQVAKVGEPIERLDGFLGADARVASAINQRQRLNDEFEFANSAVAEFDVAFDQIRRAKFRLDLMLHRAQLTQRVEIEIAAIDEAAESVEQAAAQAQAIRRPDARAASPHAPRFVRSTDKSSARHRAGPPAENCVRRAADAYRSESIRWREVR